MSLFVQYIYKKIKNLKFRWKYVVAKNKQKMFQRKQEKTADDSYKNLAFSNYNEVG